ncbi:ABC transporter permease subunit [Nostocoides sp. F2B08]|uniref:ABC transporter permease n=1 Tax=Nostocoides sp. F2B08 TaxID=2653936 RepID=UPI001262BB61|nr:ABC transporter permease [Tetrasphaera sp. F2B08]KAB7746274.1 ABC transporter permease subunit [Tetrasphaera sp. F2B08]
MLRFIVRRMVQLIGVVLVLSLLLFFWLRSLPGGPINALLGDRATPEQQEQLEQLLGLDQPLYVQYLRYMGRALQGEFGSSSSVIPGTDAFDVFLSRFPATIELAFFSVTLAIITAIPLGYFAARRRGRAVDNISIVASLVGIAVPVFFLAFLLKYYFSVKLGWLPVSGRQANLGCTRVTNFFILDGLLTREFDCSVSAVKHLILPSIALASIPFAVVFRITRASVLDVLHEDYVRTAEAKGLTARVIRGRHVLRNAMLPVLTIVGLQVGALLAGAVLTETVFSFPGIGEALALSFSARDYAVLQILILMSAVVFVVVNLVVDILYAVVDPRVRTS